MSESLSVDDISRLEKTMQLRERMVDFLFDPLKEMPDKARDIEVRLSLLDSIDNSILNKAKLKLEEGNAATDSATKSALLDLMLGLHNAPSAPRETNPERIIDVPKYEPKGIELTQGSLIPGTDNFLPEDLQ